MAIKVGDKMPAGSLTLATKDGPQKVNAEDYFKGKKVVLFSVPGAFTPTCDAKHLPGCVEKAGEIKGKGVASIACLSVNDAFVMKAWGKAQNTDGKVDMLADGALRFAPRLHHERVVHGQAGDRRDALLLDVGRLLDEPRQMLGIAGRRERTRQRKQHDLLSLEVVVRAHLLRPIRRSERERSGRHLVSDFDGHGAIS